MESLLNAVPGVGFAGVAWTETSHHKKMLRKLEEEVEKSQEWMNRQRNKVNSARDNSGDLFQKLNTMIQQEERILHKIGKSVRGKMIVPEKEKEMIDYQVQKIEKAVIEVLRMEIEPLMIG